MAHPWGSCYGQSVAATDPEAWELVERLRAQIAMLHAGNLVLRRMNSELARRLHAAPRPRAHPLGPWRRRRDDS